ncbi:unnamed protein product [Tuber aestivum]|uniref:Helitron helicase-like domain-containing protein n=1 Tax=Tuber aestivum TaxID=59557 RepID=A0A292PL27_9PEZI|nr:unnamed protein product [Tuber aestivum]
MSDRNQNFTCSTCRRQWLFSSFGTNRQGNRLRTCGQCRSRLSARYHERHRRNSTIEVAPTPHQITVPASVNTVLGGHCSPYIPTNATAIHCAEAINLPLGRTFRWITATGRSIRFAVSSLSIPCPQCQALHFLEERLTSSSAASPRFSACCLDGKISLPAFATPSVTWQGFFNREHAQSATFLKNIHEYNNTFSFLSLGVSFDLNVMQRPGPYVFRIQSQLAPLMGSLTTSKSPRYAQIYMLGTPEAQVQARLRSTSLSPEVIGELQEELLTVNPYARQWQFTFEHLHDIPHAGYLAIRLQQSTQDPRRYNLPTSPNEVAAVILREDEEEFTRGREFIAQGRTGGQLSRFDEMHPANMPLRFVLFFPAGDQGWHPSIPRTMITRSQERVTQKEFYTYHLFT